MPAVTAMRRAVSEAELVAELQHFVWCECNSCIFSTIHAVDREML